jgi:SNF2 family DNA or RNA helicase
MSQRTRFGLHDEMGIGKTATCIRALDILGATHGIVIAPAIGRAHWLAEFRKFSQRDLSIIKGENINDFQLWRRRGFGILITSYELATKWSQTIQNDGIFMHFVIFDEGHYLKNSNTKRVRELLGDNHDCSTGIAMLASKIYHVTGTPMFNDPLDIYTFLRIVKATALNKHLFIKRYFNESFSRFSIKADPKPEMIDELRNLIFSNSIRRTKKEVGLQLPLIFLTETEIDGDTKAVETMLKSHPGLDRAIIEALDMGGLSFLDSQHVATLRRLIGEAKAIPYAQLLVDELKFNPEKRVVFGVHVQALIQLRDYLFNCGINAVLVNGSSSDREKQASVYEFQTNDNCLVFIGNIRAAGTVIDLTAACEIDVMESDWTPGGNAQAIMRVHRVGQTRNVRARFVSLAKSFDTVVTNIVAAKTAAIAQIDVTAMNAIPPIKP